MERLGVLSHHFLSFTDFSHSSLQATNTVSKLVKKSCLSYPLDIHSFSLAGNATNEDRCTVLQDQNRCFFVLADGHGGTACSEYVKENLTSIYSLFSEERPLEPNCTTLMSTYESMKRAFIQLDRQYLSVCRDFMKRGHWQHAFVGACVLAADLFGDQLSIANCGDCRAVLCTRKNAKLTAVALSFDHNAANKHEQRMLLRVHPNEPDLLKENGGVAYIKGRIQCTRSIGDGFMKDPAFNTHPIPEEYRINSEYYTPPYIRPIPQVRQSVLTDADEFLVLATDGLYEMMKNEDIASFLDEISKVDRLNLDTKVNFSEALALEAQKRAAVKANISLDALQKLKPGGKRAIHDDITVIVVNLARVK